MYDTSSMREGSRSASCVSMRRLSHAHHTIVAICARGGPQREGTLDRTTQDNGQHCRDGFYICEGRAAHLCRYTLIVEGGVEHVSDTGQVSQRTCAIRFGGQPSETDLEKIRIIRRMSYNQLQVEQWANMNYNQLHSSPFL